METKNEQSIRAFSKEGPETSSVVAAIKPENASSIAPSFSSNPQSAYSVEDHVTSDDSSHPSDDDSFERQKWTNQADFIVSLLGFAVGLGNLWRFPYLCFKYGGGAFLIPYVIFMVACGAPLFFLEVSLGQFTQQGAINCWNINPLFKGIGMASTLIVFYCNSYYIVVLAWASFYFFSAFINPLEFARCDNSWNTDECYTASDLAKGIGNSSGKSSAEEFWERRVLHFHESDGLDDPGAPILHLVGCLFFVWTLCFLCIFKGIKTFGKVVYFTALAPYVIVTVFLIRAVTLDGAMEGISFYLKPDFNQLAKSEVWMAAGTQIFFSYAVCLGVLQTLASFNTFKNNCMRDCLIIAVANPATSVFAGFAVFGILGHMAHLTGKDIQDVATSGPGLVFITYPTAIGLLPGSNIWAILFFGMIILLGFDSQFAAVESFVTTIGDIWPWAQRNHVKFTLFVCVVHFAIELCMITPGGVYVFEIWNTYSASGKNLLIVAFAECVVLMWFCGRHNNRAQYALNIRQMLLHSLQDKRVKSREVSLQSELSSCHEVAEMTHTPPRLPMYQTALLVYFEISWSFLTPLLVLGLIVFEFIDTKSGMTYGGYVYPWWADLIGWAFVVSALLCVPGYMLYRLVRHLTRGGGCAPGDLNTLLEIETTPRLTKNAEEAASVAAKVGVGNAHFSKMAANGGGKTNGVCEISAGQEAIYATEA